MDSQTRSSVPVPWSSLFWGLVPVAINSMTQPGGMVCDADADVGFLLRSSPIICIVDAVLIVVQLAIDRAGTASSFREAREQLIQRRFQSDIYAGFKKSKTAEFAVNWSNEQYFRCVVFVLTLAQSVKIFAYGGIVWSKVVATLYLGSFLVIEALVVWPAAEMRNIKDTKRSGSPVVTYSSIALAVAFMLWFASVACVDILGQPHHTLPQWSAIVIGSLGTILALPALGYSSRHTRKWREVRASSGLLILVLGTPIGFYFAGRTFRDNAPLILVQLICALLSVVWGSIGLVYAIQTTKVLKEPDKDHQRKKVEQVSAWYFFLLHLITALLYFLFSYDATDTAKPAWTKYLG